MLPVEVRPEDAHIALMHRDPSESVLHVPLGEEYPHPWHAKLPPQYFPGELLVPRLVCRRVVLLGAHEVRECAVPYQPPLA